MFQKRDIGLLFDKQAYFVYTIFIGILLAVNIKMYKKNVY
jgi:hypothetical protein